MHFTCGRYGFQPTQGTSASRYGPWALVTGAGRGIGRGFAVELAARGFDLVLTDVDQDRLAETAAAIRADHGRAVDPLVLDLTAPTASIELAEHAAAHDVGLVICNHLVPADPAPFLETGSDEARRQLDGNVRAYVEITHAFGHRLHERGRGGVILMSSLAGIVGSPYVALYGAAKAFVLAFGSALSYEWHDTEVDVLTVVPISVDTETFRRTRVRPSWVARPMTVEAVVGQALGQLGRRPVMVPGTGNALASAAFGRLMPRRLSLSVMGSRLAPARR